MSRHDHDHDHDHSHAAHDRPQASHGHHGHSHGIEAKGDGLVAGAVATNLILTAAQVVGGVWAGSVALIADAMHNLSDALALIIAFAARRIARRPAHPSMSFGYGRAELVAALVNYTVLVTICLWLAYAAAERLIDPPPVQGRIVILLAALALVINLITALLTFRLAKDSLNIRAAFLHNLSDAGTSLAVILSGLLVSGLGWRWADPVVTILISAWILWHALHEVGPVIRILMLGAPSHAGGDALRQAIGAQAGVSGVHHLHVWQIDEHRISVEAHLVLEEGAEAPEVLARIRAVLAAGFGIDHSTFEVERPGAPCGVPDCG